MNFKSRTVKSLTCSDCDHETADGHVTAAVDSHVADKSRAK